MMKILQLILIILVSCTLTITGALAAVIPNELSAIDNEQIQNPNNQYYLREKFGRFSSNAERPRANQKYLLGPSVDVGEPGLSFSYKSTLGVTSQAYPANAAYINAPHGLFVNTDDDLYVTEDRGFRVLRYSSTGSNEISIGVAGLSQTEEDIFSNPQDVVEDSGGNFWVADDTRIVQYDTAGNFLQQLPEDDPWAGGDSETRFEGAAGIAFDSSDTLFVADANNHRVQVYALPAGSPVYSTTIGVTGVPGSDDDHFNIPVRIAIDDSDRLYVVDMENDRVQRCTYSGGWSCLTFVSGLDRPLGVAMDNTNNVYILDEINYRVLKCDSGGVCVDLITSLPGYHIDVAVDSLGNVYVSNWTHHVVGKYSSAGVFLGNFLGHEDQPYVPDTIRINEPWGVAVDNDGSVLVAERSGYRVLKFDATYNQLWSLGQAGVYGSTNDKFGSYWSGPKDVDTTSNGDVYVADTGNHRIQIFDEDGIYKSTFGSYGTGNYEFDTPDGIYVDKNDYLYVADEGNHRVLIYNNNLIHTGTLGTVGVAGSGNNQFDEPDDVAVNSLGNIYVADEGNHRVQVFDSGLNFLDTLGTTGVSGEAFDLFDNPQGVAVDKNDNVYVADTSNIRIQVFDETGKYLTTIGGEWGWGTAQFRGVQSVDVDDYGNVYVADRWGHRIQKYKPGVDGWTQVNINGFGDIENDGSGISLQAFGDYLYAGLGNPAGGQVWRTDGNSSWTQVTGTGFGNTDNKYVRLGVVFNGYLYAGMWNGTTGSEVYRSLNGLSWSPIASGGFDNSDNVGIGAMAVFDNYLYTGTTNYSTGTEIWQSSNGTTWSQVNVDGFGDSYNGRVRTMAVFKNALYVGTHNPETGVEIWRTSNGTTWEQVNGDGFGDAYNQWPSMAILGNYLYVGTANDTNDSYEGTGTQIWRSMNGTLWEQVVGDGFGDSTNGGSDVLVEFDGALYSSTYNWETGTQIRKSIDGIHWTMIAPDGLGDSNNYSIYGATGFKNSLYLATANEANGAEVWQMLHKLYLPFAVSND